MRRLRRSSVAWLIGLGIGSLAAPCKASEASVEVACDDLPEAGRGEVEARARATLLTSSFPGARVAIRCEAAGATVTAEAGNRTESVTLTLPIEHREDALVEATERALSALGAAPRSTASFPVDEGTPKESPPPSPPPPAGPAPIREADSAPSRPSPATEPKAEVRLGLGFLVEHWIDFPTLGARALGELEVRPWSVGLALGGLAGPKQENAFVPSEWHALALGALDAKQLGGLRLGTGLGLSALVASPRGGTVAHSGTLALSAFVNFSISRPVRFGRFALVPELGARVFTRSREVVVDGETSFYLRPLAPSALLWATADLWAAPPLGRASGN